MLATILLFIAIYISVLLLFGIKNRKKFPEPPLLKGNLPIIGHFHLVNRLWTFFENISLKSLDTGALTINLAWQKFYVIGDPYFCQTLSKCLPEKSPSYKYMKIFLGEGLLSGDVVTWKRHRKYLNPAFSPIILDGYMATFNNQARKLVDNLLKEVGKGPFDQLDYIAPSSLESVIYTLMGIDEENDAHVKNALVKATQKTKALFMTLCIKIWFQISFIRNMFQIQNEINEVSNQLTRNIEKIIEQKQRLLKTSLPEFTRVKFQPFLDVVLSSTSAYLNKSEIRDEVITMLFAGYDTVNITNANVLKLLGCHQDIEDKVYKELYEIFGDCDRDVENEDLKQMVILEAVIKETLRLYPTIPLVGRLVDKNIDLGKFRLLRGSSCLISIYALHRHPAWGPDANLFNPLRWLNQTIPDTKLYYAPFAMGKRSCIGQVYAMKIMTVTLAHILRRYKVSADDNKIDFVYGMSITPQNNHQITITERNLKT